MIISGRSRPYLILFSNNEVSVIFPLNFGSCHSKRYSFGFLAKLFLNSRKKDRALFQPALDRSLERPLLQRWRHQRRMTDLVSWVTGELMKLAKSLIRRFVFQIWVTSYSRPNAYARPDEYKYSLKLLGADELYDEDDVTEECGWWW